MRTRVQVLTVVIILLLTIIVSGAVLVGATDLRMERELGPCITVLDHDPYGGVWYNNVCPLYEGDV
jgi:hypothetical protein